MAKSIIFLTGATGTMGFEGLKALLTHRNRYSIRILARNSKKNRKKLKYFIDSGAVEVIWGDLTCYDDILRGVRDADVVLHVGGMVSPAADYFPEQTMKVNTVSCANIVRAIHHCRQADTTRVVYIGSISQYGSHEIPFHWARTGDPLWHAEDDMYALSKIRGERIIAEGGLKYWVSIRQTGILSPLLVNKGSDPITFHVPLNGALEWTTDTESGTLLANICNPSLPEDFWRNFYNLGNGSSFRLSNYEFESLILKAMHCPKPEKIFEPHWFALRNFHGVWYADSDILDDYLHFRNGLTVKQYLSNFSRSLPFYFSLTPLAPAFLIKAAMKAVASKRPNGTLHWIKTGDQEAIRRAYGSREALEAIPGWDDFNINIPPQEIIRLDHGYDESKPEQLLDIDDMRRAAEFRGGRCLSPSMTPGDLSTPLEWCCHEGHHFTASPRLILKGGHWCDRCFNENADYPAIAAASPFFAQSYCPSPEDHIG